jgi:hypothetical protein
LRYYIMNKRFHYFCFDLFLLNSIIIPISPLESFLVVKPKTSFLLLVEFIEVVLVVDKGMSWIKGYLHILKQKPRGVLNSFCLTQEYNSLGDDVRIYL